MAIRANVSKIITRKRTTDQLLAGLGTVLGAAGLGATRGGAGLGDVPDAAGCAEGAFSDVADADAGGGLGVARGDTGLGDVPGAASLDPGDLTDASASDVAGFGFGKTGGAGPRTPAGRSDPGGAASGDLSEVELGLLMPDVTPARALATDLTLCMDDVDDEREWPGLGAGEMPVRAAADVGDVSWDRRAAAAAAADDVLPPELMRERESTFSPEPVRDMVAGLRAVV